MAKTTYEIIRHFQTFIWDAHFEKSVQPERLLGIEDLNPWFISPKQIDHFDEYIRAGGKESEVSISHYFPKAKLLSFIEWMHLDELEAHIWIHIRIAKERNGQFCFYDNLKRSADDQFIKCKLYEECKNGITLETELFVVETKIVTMAELKKNPF